MRLPKAHVFADVGCDHGYCTQYAFEHELCERAYVTDISEGSLQKAKTLLQKYVRAGRCMPVVCDGMDGIDEACPTTLYCSR